MDLIKNQLAIALLPGCIEEDQERINALPGRLPIFKTDSDGDLALAHWEVPKACLRDILENWERQEIVVQPAALPLFDAYYAQVTPMFDLPPIVNQGYTFTREPKPWQEKYIFLNPLKRGLLCCLNIGFGKTLAALERARVVEGGYDFKLLIICPKKVMTNWQSEIRMTYDRPSFKFWCEGKKVSEMQKLLPLQEIVVTSYEMAKHIQKHFRPQQIIIDEIHSVKTDKAERTKVIKALVKANPTAGIQGLSGTLVHNQPVDMYTPINICSPGLLGSKPVFKAKYTKATDHVYIDKEMPSGHIKQIKIPVGFRPINLDKLHEQIKPCVYTVDPTNFLTFEDCTNYVVVDMVGEQKQLYEKTLNEFLDAVDCGSIMPGDQLTALIHLRMLAEGAFHAEEAETQDSGKLDYVYEYLEDKPPQEKIIIWSCFRKGIEILYEKYKDKGAVVFHGGVSDNKAQLALYSFQGCRTDEEYAHFEQLKRKAKDWPYEPGSSSILFSVMHQNSSLGYNLNSASKQIVLSADYLDSTLSQALGRIKRLDNTAACVETTFLHSQDTDEYERLLTTLKKGQVAAQVLLGAKSDQNLARVQEINRLRKVKERMS